MAVLCQDRLKKRKTDFYQSIESLKLHPESLNLQAKSRQYHHDSLLIYYHDLLHSFSINSGRMNRWQRIAYYYETGLVRSSLELTDSAIQAYESALALIDKQLNPREYLRLNMEMAYSYRELSMYKKSNSLYLEVLSLPAIQKDTAEQIHCSYFLAENYENLGEYQKSMELCQKLYNYSMRKGDYANASYNLTQIGRMAAFLEKDTSFLEYYHLANNLALKSDVKSRTGNNLVSTGYAYNDLGLPGKALPYFIAGERFSDAYSPRDHLYCLSGLSRTYLKIDSLAQALNYARKSMKIATAIQGYEWMSGSCEVMADCYIKLHNYDSARYFLLEAVITSRKTRNGSIASNMFRKLSDVNTALHDYPAAIAYLDTAYNSFVDFVRKNNDDKLAKLRIESDYYIHKSRITELITKNKIEKEKSKHMIIMFSAISVILCLSILFSVLRLRQLRKLKESYIGLIKKNIELDQLNKKLAACESRPSKKTRQESQTKEEEVIAGKLKTLFKRDEIFTNPGISLKMLANELKTNTSYLSATINHHFECNLKTLINKYRVDKARKMMISDQFSHYSMDGIAREVGFNSRSVFYSAFKGITGIIPTIYIQNYKIALDSAEMKETDENCPVS